MKVKIQNYQAIKHAELEFLPGITAIVGSSNNGKSSIIRAIQGAINNQGGSKFINYDADACEVTIEDLGNTVTWKKSKKAGKSSYTINGQELLKIGQKQVDDVANVLNMKEIEINAEKVRINFWKQLDYPFLVGKTPYQLFDFISRSKEQEAVAGLETSLLSEKKTVNAAISYTVAQVDLKKLTIEELEKEIQSLGVFQQIDTQLIEKRLTAFESFSNNLLSIHKKQQMLSNEVIKKEALERVVKPTESLVTRISERMKLYEENKKLLKSIEAKSTQLSRAIKTAEDSKREADKIAKLADNIKVIMGNIAVNAEKLKQTKDALNSCSKIQKAIDAQKTIMASLKHKKEEYEAELASFEFCPLCNQPLKNHEVKHD